MNKNMNFGNMTETMVCDELQKHGYWCHRMKATKSGQPCDIVAIKRNRGILIDAKHCCYPNLNTKRIEPNQRACFEYASGMGIECGFAIYFEGNFYWLPWEQVELDKPKQVWSEFFDDFISKQ